MFFRRALVVLIILCPISIYAGAFQLWEESANDTGDYHAGAAAEGRDASDIFYNPALMTRFDKPEISVGGVLIALGVNYTGSVSVNGNPQLPSVNQVAGDTLNFVPNFHYVQPLSSRWTFAFEETTPFGLSTNYPNTPNINYLATETQLQTFNLNPSLAYKINQIISLGVGFDAMYGSAVYDDGLGNFATLTDDLSGWGYGYNAGILAQFSPRTRAGLSYRSAITIPAKGPSAYSDAFGNHYNSTASTNFPLPPTTMFSIFQDMSSRFSLMGSVFYTQWSVFKELIISNIAFSGNPITVATNENYCNTWNYSIGGLYKITPTISIEAGGGHDETPTQIPYRDIRLPDSSRYAASIGVNIQPSPTFGWSMGWTHFFTGNTPVNNSASNNTSQSSSSAANIVGIGTVSANVNVLGMQLNWVI